jgi:hypothetical protein
LQGTGSTGERRYISRYSQYVTRDRIKVSIVEVNRLGLLDRILFCVDSETATQGGYTPLIVGRASIGVVGKKFTTMRLSGQYPIKTD